jgi:predicted CXXCH cytochrome family protein
VNRFKNNKKLQATFIVAICTFIFLFIGTENGLSKDDIPHLNKSKLKSGCLSCHGATRKLGLSTKLMPDDRCLRCHGPGASEEERARSDIFSLLSKRSRHPILETARYHERNEILPERVPSKPRHVSCLDCHNPHTTRPGKIYSRVRGTDISGIKRAEAEKESHVCYNCHSDSINLPPDSPNMRLEFDPSNASYHPVERSSKGRSVSLYKNMAQGSKITCTDCHDPHGSDYPPLLRVNYTMTDGAESPFAYDLCYGCHNRESILSNQSFKGSQMRDYGHKEHIVYQNTSCYTCHASHGSKTNPKLVEFNTSIVTGFRQYLNYGGGRAQCNLTCHGKMHK